MAGFKDRLNGSDQNSDPTSTPDDRFGLDDHENDGQRSSNNATDRTGRQATDAGNGSHKSGKQGFGSKFMSNLSDDAKSDLKHAKLPGKDTVARVGRESLTGKKEPNKPKKSNLADKAKKGAVVAKVGEKAGKAAGKGYLVADVVEKLKMALANLVTMILNNPLFNVAGAVWGAIKGFAASAMGFVKGMASGFAAGVAHIGSAVAGAIGVSAKVGTTIVSSVIIAGSSAGAIAAGGAIMPYFYSDAGETCTTDKDATADAVSDSLTKHPGEWTKKGTTAYKNAKTIWDGWKKHGFGGAAISGVLGNISAEGGFTIPDRAEGHMGDDPKTNGIAAGVIPSGGSGYSVGGGGPYQLTPYTRFAPAGNKDWLDLTKQTDFLYDKEISKGLLSWPYNTDGMGVGNFTKYAHLSEPAKASRAWYSMVERGASYDSAKDTAAGQAYTTFDGSSVSADDSLLGAGASSGSANGAADSNTAAAGSAAENACKTDSDEDVADGTGSIKESSAQGVLHWAKDAVPDDVKKYIHDPKDAGLAWESADGWFNGTGEAANQCVGFASSYFYAIWSNLKSVMVPGGVDETTYWAEKNGGEKTKVPKAGAIASAPGGVSGVSSNGKWGHTWVVQHVLSNGDIILVEQNMKGLSGEGNGTKNTWNFGWMSKDKYTDAGITFYTPKGDHKLSWKKGN